MKQYTTLGHKNQSIQSVVKGTDFLIYEAITAGWYNFGNNQSIWAKINNNNELIEEFPRLYESFNTTTVIIEACKYYNSFQLLIWVLIDNITEI